MTRPIPFRVCIRTVTVPWQTVLLWCILTASGLAARLDAQRFEARLLDQDKNFAGLDVSALAQDRLGHLWIAMQSGVLLYDGSRFRAFGREDGLTDPAAFSLLVDPSGTVWAGGHGGLFWFDGQRFHEVLYQGKSLHVGVNSMLAASPSGEIAVRTQLDVISITRTGHAGEWSVETYWQRHPGHKSGMDWNGLGFEANGGLAVGCGEALCIFEDGHDRILGVAEGVAPDFYVSIFRARDGTLWARGRKHIVTVRPGEASAKEVGDLLQPGALTTIHRRFTEDAAGDILSPTALGFATWDGGRWTETDSTSQGPIGAASEVFCDREGSVWIGTDGAGLLESRGYRVWANYGREQGFVSPNITTIAKDGAGTIWFGTTQRTMLLKKGAASMIDSPLKDQQDTEDVLSLAPSADGGMWAGTQLGSIDHVTASGSVDMTASIDAYIRRIRLATDGVLWVGTSRGLFTLRCEQKKPCAATPYAGDGWTHAAVRDFVLDPDGSIWTVGDSGLILIRNGRARSFPVFENGANNTVADENGADKRTGGQTAFQGRIDLIAIDTDHSLWLARSNKDLLHVRVSGDHGEAIARYAKPQLPSDAFSFIEPTPNGDLWFGTDRGLGKIRMGALSLAEYDDGLIWNSTGEHAFLADSDGTVWVGTTLGVSHLLRPEDAFTRKSFPAEVQSIGYNESRLENGARLPWTGGVTQVDFAGLTFKGNQSLIYSYRLEGFDDLVVRTHTPFVRYQKLPPGSYVFHVVAHDPVHDIYSIPAEVSFTLLPPWWLTWWFKSLMALAGLLVLIALWHGSHLALLAQRRRLQRLVAERTSKLEQMVIRDGLTGLLNRNAILEKLASELQAARTGGKSLCVSLIDLDHFKSINDTHGHLAGDTVLREAAIRLRNAVRSTDFIGRYGGEEFIVIFTGIERDPGIDRCELMRQALCSRPVLHESTQLTVTCSIGLTGWMGDTDTLAELIARADRAMYAAKSGGRNRVEFAA